MKNAIRLAVLCIIVGIIGIAFFGYEFGDERIAYDQQLSFPATEIDSLDLQTEDSTRIVFKSTEEDTVSVHFKGKWNPDTVQRLEKLQPENTRLTIDTRSKGSFSFLNFSTDFSTNIMEISIPNQKWLTDVTLNNTSSDNEISDLYAKHITLKATSGNLKLQNIQADDLTVTLTSGTLKADQIKTAQAARIELTSGNVKISSMEAANITITQKSGDIKMDDILGDVDAKLTSGNLVLNGLSGQGTVRMTSGDIRLIQNTNDNVDIETTSGNVTITAASDFAGFYDAQATFGSVHTPDSLRTGTELMKVRTTSGDINITQP